MTNIEVTMTEHAGALARSAEGEPAGFAEWAVVDIVGHQQVVGRVAEVTLAGVGFLRVDIPAASGKPSFTQFYGARSVHCLTPVTEEVARRAAASLRPEPVARWMLQLEADQDPVWEPPL